MASLHPVHPLRVFWISGLLTLLTGVLVAYYAGPAALWIYSILVILEVTFSFDNAVINSKILTKLSPFWQTMFLTVGIIFAVFIVRFVMPIFIVMISSDNSFMGVIDMALNNEQLYGETLHQAAPMINAFGGTFLMMIGLSYFLDRHKDVHWLRFIESRLSRFGHYESFKILVMLSVAMILYTTVDEKYHTVVLAASIVGTMLHIALNLFERYFSRHLPSGRKLVGLAAFASFLYLNVLDASFSLDGVIGAFAITNEVLLIMAGLGAGAFWVRSLTIYLVRAKTLGKYRYLEHGAHWAILALGVVMFIKLYHIEPPEWMTGSLGLVFIVTAIVSSILERRRKPAASLVK